MSADQRSIQLPIGEHVVARFYEPSSAPRASVLLPAAMGVSQLYYAKFAEWLSHRGYRVATFDYRGIGLSAPAQLKDYPITIFDWARQDCAAMIDEMKRSHPHVPLYWVGHSLGGQLLGLIPNRDRIERVITVATGSGYWRENSPALKRKVWWMWYVAVPLALRIAGYFPGKRLRKVGDLPPRVIEQWRRWCLNPEYVVGAEGQDVRDDYARVRQPILALSFTDDEMMSERNIHSLHSFYRNAPVQHRRIAPCEVGEQEIGHFGFFRARFEASLWPMIPQWLEET